MNFIFVNKNFFLLIIFLIVIFVVLIYVNNNTTKEKFYSTRTPRIIWTYWENKNNQIGLPTHIQLCFDTFKKHLDSKYNVIILNEKTIKNYLPNVRNDLDNLMIAQKVDYYRIALLEMYGGIWIDADTIIMRDLDEIFNKLDEEYDFVGFGCTKEYCINGKNEPSNGVLASRKNSLLMKLTLQKLDDKLNNRTNDSTFGYYDLGKITIWEALNDLQKNGYDYYHYPSEYDGTRDKQGKWVHTTNHFSNEKTDLINEDKLFFVFLTNSGINSYYPWVGSSDKNEILYGSYWISSLFRKSLNINNQI